MQPDVVLKVKARIGTAVPITTQTTQKGVLNPARDKGAATTPTTFKQSLSRGLANSSQPPQSVTRRLKSTEPAEKVTPGPGHVPKKTGTSIRKFAGQDDGHAGATIKRRRWHTWERPSHLRSKVVDMEVRILKDSRVRIGRLGDDFYCKYNQGKPDGTV